MDLVHTVMVQYSCKLLSCVLFLYLGALLADVLSLAIYGGGAWVDVHRSIKEFLESAKHLCFRLS